MTEVLASEFLGRTVAGPGLARIVDLVLEVLSADIDRLTLTDSLRHLAGKPITFDLLDQTCWRIAGNTQRLKQRRTVPPWHGQRLLEWVPAQVVSCRFQRDRRETIGVTLGFRILTGTPCGLTAYKWWSLKMARYASPRFGYARPRGAALPPLAYSQPSQLVGLRTLLLIHPDYCERAPGFERVAFTAALNAWNAVTLKCRARVMPGFTCVAGRTAAQPCHACPVGFLKCRAATHRADWVQRPCAGCGTDAWFDPERADEVCIACAATEIYIRKKP